MRNPRIGTVIAARCNRVGCEAALKTVARRQNRLARHADDVALSRRVRAFRSGIVQGQYARCRRRGSHIIDRRLQRSVVAATEIAVVDAARISAGPGWVGSLAAAERSQQYRAAQCEQPTPQGVQTLNIVVSISFQETA